MTIQHVWRHYVRFNIEIHTASQSVSSPRCTMQRGIHGLIVNEIADPDRSNPTRSRWERPLDTIRSFEAAIDGNYARKSGRYGKLPLNSKNSIFAILLLTSNSDGATESRRSSYYGGMSISGFSLGALPRIPANGAIYGVAHDYLLSASSLSSQAITVNHEQVSRVCALAHAVNRGISTAWKNMLLFFQWKYLWGWQLGDLNACFSCAFYFS